MGILNIRRRHVAVGKCLYMHSPTTRRLVAAGLSSAIPIKSIQNSTRFGDDGEGSLLLLLLLVIL